VLLRSLARLRFVYIAQLLISRGCGDELSARSFLQPSQDQLTSLSHAGMSQAYPVYCKQSIVQNAFSFTRLRRRCTTERCSPAGTESSGRAN